MTRHVSNRVLLAIVLAGVLLETGCERQCRVTKSVTSYGLETSYTYDSQERLERIDSLAANRLQDRTLFEYDTSGRLTKETIELPWATYKHESIEYTYDSPLAARAQYFRSTDGVNYTRYMKAEYAYDDAARLRKVTYRHPSDVRFGELTVEPDGAGNVARTSYLFFNAAGEVTGARLRSFIYDTKRLVGEVRYWGPFFPELELYGLIKNNVTDIAYTFLDTSGSVTSERRDHFTYEYRDDDYPSKVYGPLEGNWRALTYVCDPDFLPVGW